jgi:two-component system sensor histidine kinase/response regulator
MHSSDPTRLPESLSRRAGDPTRKPLALVVDDQQVQRIILREALERDGFEVAEADNGRAALDLFDQTRPDIVLLDVNMPEMDGFEVCSAMRARKDGALVPVLMLTVLGDEASIDRAFEAGATDFVTKPVVWPILGRRLHYMLRASAAFQDLARSEADLARRVMERTASLDEANRNLETANRELEAFTYSVSHDLRAPLRTIDGYIKLIFSAAKPIDHEFEEPLQRIRAACAWMGQLIEDLLKLSSVTRRELVKHDADLSSAAAEVVDNLRRANPGREVEVFMQPGLKVRADTGLLRIMLENLLGNAFKFTAKTPRARIEVGRNEQMELFVRDNGAGFNPAYADKLFTPFQRLHTQSEFEGTGIGLAIVSRIVIRHGGSVRAVGEPDKGAAFYFTLDKQSN